MTIVINGSTGIESVDGSAASPSVRGSDGNSGIVYAADTVSISTGGTERLEVDSSGNIDIPDNGKIRIGTGNDLSLYHNGNSRITHGGAGNLIVETTATDSDLYLRGKDKVVIQPADGEEGIICNANGSVELYYDNSKKFETSSTGTTTTGNQVTTGQIVAASGFSQVDASAYLISTSSVGSASQTYYIGNQAIQTSSDRRLKENIVDTEVDASSELKKVRVVDFTWNDPSDKATTNRNSRGKWIGCIAQEIADVFPFAVNAPRDEDDKIDNDSEALWGMEYGQLVPVLIKAVQELSAEVETLKTKVAALEAG